MCRAGAGGTPATLPRAPRPPSAAVRRAWPSTSMPDCGRMPMTGLGWRRAPRLRSGGPLLRTDCGRPL